MVRLAHGGIVPRWLADGELAANKKPGAVTSAGFKLPIGDAF